MKPLIEPLWDLSDAVDSGCDYFSQTVDGNDLSIEMNKYSDTPICIEIDDGVVDDYYSHNQTISLWMDAKQARELAENILKYAVYLETKTQLKG